MTTILLLVAIAALGRTVIKYRHENKMLKAKAKISYDIKPTKSIKLRKIPAKPDSNKDYSTVCEPVNPLDRIVIPSDVIDILTLYTYLVQRSSNKKELTDFTNPVMEMDSFIKNNMIDLRDQKGLICTDGHYLLQYAKKNTGDKFLLVEMKSPKMIQSINYKYNDEEFIPKWDKMAEDVIRKIGPKKFRELMFKHTKFNLGIYQEDCGVTYKTVIGKEDAYNLSEDPIQSIRKSIDYSFDKSVRNIIGKFLKETREEFGVGKHIAAIDESNNIYCLIWDNQSKRYFIVPSDTMKNIYTNQNIDSIFNEYPVAKPVRDLIDKIDNHKDEIIKTKSYSKFNDLLGLKFIAFEI